MAKLKFESGSKDEDQQQKPGAPEDRGIVEKVDELLEQALSVGATDLHVEPGTDETRVRARVGGALQQLGSFPANIHHKVVNRFKILADMDITRNKIAQRGFFRIKQEDSTAECTAFVFPSSLGEKVTVNVLLKTGFDMSLEHLGFFTEVLKSYKDAIAKPHGLVLVVGPPASGRTSTCYATLAALSSPQKSVSTFEPLVKYELAGVVHSKPAPQHGYSFEDGVRAMMDSDPDVCLVGEVQDPEVARCMLQGAFSKRIVIGRMAAHDAAGALDHDGHGHPAFPPDRRGQCRPRPAPASEDL